MQFKNHTEKTFWEGLIAVLIPSFNLIDAAHIADAAVEARRTRMKELNLGQKPPEHMQLPE